jgi:hypothetical protein
MQLDLTKEEVEDIVRALKNYMEGTWARTMNNLKETIKADKPNKAEKVEKITKGIQYYEAKMQPIINKLEEAIKNG